MKKVFLNSQENICATVSFLIKETLAQVFSCEFCNKKKKFIRVFFHEHSRITGQQGKGKGFSVTPLYHFHPLHRHLDISRAITTGGSETRTGNLRFPSAGH